MFAPSMSVNVRLARASTPSATPKRFGVGTSRVAVGDTSVRTTTTTASAPARLIRKTARQLATSMRTPAATGPAPKPTAMAMETNATARVRSPGLGKASRMSATPDGVMAAAPTPASSWPATMTPRAGAAAETAEPAANSAAPANRMRLAPRRSAIAPAGSSRLANATA